LAGVAFLADLLFFFAVFFVFFVGAVFLREVSLDFVAFFLAFFLAAMAAV
jgi:hypothetical protein